MGLGSPSGAVLSPEKKSWGQLTSSPTKLEYRSTDVLASSKFRQVPRCCVTSACGSALALADTVPLAEPKRDATMPILGAKPMPKVFTFYTWWIEKSKRVDMVMDFYPDRKLWRCRVDVPLPVQIFRRSTGELLDVWDLHVGARVDVLGRTVTLRQASLDTITWLDHQARRLIRRKQQLEHSLNKFCHTPYTAVQHHSHHHDSLKRNPQNPLGGKLHLGGLRDEVAALSQRLAAYTSGARVDGETEAEAETSGEGPAAEEGQEEAAAQEATAEEAKDAEGGGVEGQPADTAIGDTS